MNVTTIGELFAIGRRISYTGDMCNPSGRGAIVALDHPTQSVDILLADGRELRRVSFCSLVPAEQRNGCAHRYLVEDGYADEAEIAALHAGAAMLKADETAKRAEASRRFAEEVERLKAEYPQLTQGDGAKVAAANARALLKAAFPGVKISVRSGRATYSSTMCLEWTDGPTVKQVEEIAERFSAGQFDGMIDCYEYQRSPWNETFGSAQYVSCNRRLSDALVQRAIDAIAAETGATVKPTVEDYNQGRAWNVSPISNWSGENHWSWQTAINRAAAEISCA